MCTNLNDAVDKLKLLIKECESLKGKGIAWGRFHRWKDSGVEILRKILNDEEAVKFKQVDDFIPPPSPLPNVSAHPLLDEDCYIVGEQEKLFGKILNTHRCNF